MEELGLEELRHPDTLSTGEMALRFVQYVGHPREGASTEAMTATPSLGPKRLRYFGRFILSSGLTMRNCSKSHTMW